MEPDDNEAFIHNVCKKTAQLARVATDFNNARFDQLEKAKILEIQHEKNIKEILDKEKRNNKSEFNNLVRYRKSMIEESCKEYGIKYKQIKSDIAQSLNDTNREFCNILRESKHTNRDGKDITRDSIIFAKNVISSADEVERSIKTQIRCRTPEDDEKCAKEMNEWKEKGSIVVKNSQKKINEMKQNYKEVALEIKEKLKEVILKEVRNRKEDFLCNLSKLKELEKETKELRKLHQKHSEEIKNALKTANIMRKNYINEVNKEYLDIKEKKTLTARAIKDDKLNGSYAVSQMRAQLNILRKNQNKIKSELAKLSEEQKNDQRNLEKIFAQKRKERIEMLSKEESNFMDKQKGEIEMKLEEIKIQQQLIEERRLTTEYIEDKSHELKNMFMEELAAKQNDFHESLKKMEERMEDKFNNENKTYNRWNNEYINALKSAFTIISDESRHHRKIIRKSSHKVKKEIAESLKTNEKEIMQKEEENKEKIKEFQNTLNIKSNERIENNQNRVNQLNVANIKKFESIKTNFGNDLMKKKEEINASKQIKEEPYSLCDEESEFKRKKDKLEAELEYTTNQIEKVKIKQEKVQNDFQTSLIECDKKKRMIERNKKTSSDEIIEDFEVQIQMEQVQLADKIDKLSSLYNKEENERGRDIIELIRKVAQVKSRTKDLSAKIIEKKDEKMKNIENEKEKINEEINRIKCGKAEEELNSKFKELEDSFANRIKEMDEASTKIKNEIQKSMEECNEKCSLMKKSFDEESKKDNEEINKQIIRIKEKKEVIDKEKEEKKNEILESFNEKKADLEKEYSREISKMKMRIASALENLNNEKENCDKKYKEAKEKYSAEYEEKFDKLPQFEQKDIDELLKVNSMLHLNIESLSGDILDLMFKYFVAEQNAKSAKKIKEIKDTSDAKMTEISDVFNILFKIRMRRMNHPVFYKTIATNTDTGPIPPSAYEIPKVQSLGHIPAHTPTSGTRPKAAIFFPRSSRVPIEGYV